MWDRFFRQRAYIGITRSRMRWYVRKNYLTSVKNNGNPNLVCEKTIDTLPYNGHQSLEDVDQSLEGVDQSLEGVEPVFVSMS